MPLASFENPVFSGKHGLFRTTMMGTLSESVSRTGAARTLITAESVFPGPQNLRYNVTNRGTQLQRPYTRSSFIYAVTTAANANTNSRLFEEIQNNRSRA